MFNFFNEIKKGIKNHDFTGEYHLVNISGKIIYIEGHKGIVLISKEVIAFKVKNGRIVVEGRDLILEELSENTIKISGSIKKIEAF